jgi:hypothetical protein
MSVGEMVLPPQFGGTNMATKKATKGNDQRPEKKRIIIVRGSESSGDNYGDDYGEVDLGRRGTVKFFHAMELARIIDDAPRHLRERLRDELRQLGSTYDMSNLPRDYEHLEMRRSNRAHNRAIAEKARARIELVERTERKRAEVKKFSKPELASVIFATIAAMLNSSEEAQYVLERLGVLGLKITVSVWERSMGDVSSFEINPKSVTLDEP